MAAKGKATFNGPCHWCPKPGHKASECRAKTAYLKSKGLGREAKGYDSAKAKGKGKGGKGKGSKSVSSFGWAWSGWDLEETAGDHNKSEEWIRDPSGHYHPRAEEPPGTWS